VVLVAGYLWAFRKYTHPRVHANFQPVPPPNKAPES
jgi:hypothetical protein